MTERFEIFLQNVTKDGTLIIIQKGLKLYNISDVVDLLNELNDECEFLEIENESLEDGATKYAELYHKSLKENEQLKKQKEWCRNKLNIFLTKTNELHEENEKLKQQVEDLEFNLRTIEAYDRTVKEEHSDTVYDFKKKLEKW